MYIDSPVFVRRKVLINGTDHAEGQQYIFGSERQKIAQHVRQQIGEHDKDALILEKFRRQAQQRKRRRFQQKCKKFSPFIEPLQHQFYELPQILNEKNQENLQIPATVSRVIEDTQPNNIKLQSIEKQQLSQVQIDDKLLHYYQQILKGKDKELRKKQRKLEKSKMVIQKMNGKIKEMRQQRRMSHKQKELEIIKINALVEEMNYRIAQNKATFREELARLKFDLASSDIYKTPLSVSRHTQRHFSIPTIPKNKVYNINHDSERLLQGPSVYYGLPAKSTLDMNRRQLDTNLETFDRSLNRMKDSQQMLQSKLQKYRQLL